MVYAKTTYERHTDDIRGLNLIRVTHTDDV